MICISIKPKTLPQLRSSIKQAEAIADLIEIRLDEMGDLPPNLIQEVKLPIILTLLSQRHGGSWCGTKQEQQKQLEQLATLHPAYLDVEDDLDQEFIAELKKNYPSLQMIISHHNITETPKDLEGLLTKMHQRRGDLYKIAVQAKNTSDALRVLLFSKNAGRDVLAFAMGSEGQVSRILSPIVNNPWTYAALSNSATTASGQLTAKTLHEVYHYDRLSPTTKIYGLFGDPVTSSIGYLFHNEVYHKHNIDAVYLSMRVQKSELAECLELCRQLEVRGLSMTSPLKETVLPFIDEIDPTAQKIGAINTLTFSSAGIHGSNTDAQGGLDAIERHTSVAGKHVVILGAGGAARALAFEAKCRGAKVTVLSRRNCEIASGTIAEMKKDYDILINATPSPMPIATDLIVKGCIVMDLKTLPRNTEFLIAASKRGCRCIYGEEMFKQQAIGQLQRWFSIDIKPIIQV